MPEYTPAQKMAIYTRNKDVLVSAAAGSGKTAVLSQRVFTMLCDTENPIDIDRLLIVTFTNAAAAEMKSRIGQKISDALDSDNLSDIVRQRLMRQLTLLPRASIMTIHSYCLDLIKNNFHLLDINPAFRVAEENEIKLMKLEAADEMLEHMYSGKNPARFSMLCRWLGYGRDEVTVQRILELYDFIRSFSDPFKWLNTAIEMYNPEKFTGADSLCWCEAIRENLCTVLDSAATDCENLISYAENYGLLGYASTLKSDLQTVNRLMKICVGKWDDLVTLADSLKFEVLSRKEADCDEAAASYVKSSRDKLKKSLTNTLSAIKGLTGENIKTSLGEAYPMMQCLHESVLAFDCIFTSKKHDAGVLDFNDFEHFAHDLLRDENNGIAAAQREKYVEIFVDEYQDCNDAQESLFMHICRKRDGKPCNMFMVGDVKQSIYRFRQADPTIFIDKSNRYPTDGESSIKIPLNKNFRSNSIILDCINRLFGRVMNSYSGEIEYTDEERLYYRSDEIPSDEPKCELLIADAGGDFDDDIIETNDDIEAHVIASRILELAAQGTPFGDIAVLMRGTSNHISSFEDEFRRRDIPYYVDAPGGLFSGTETRIFLSLLKVIDNPMQDIPLVGVLRSPIFGFTENSLVEIRNFSKGLFFSAVEQCAKNDNGETGEKCQIFLNKLYSWRDIASTMPIDEFIEFLIRETSIDNFAAALPGGDLRRVNIDELLNIARHLQSSGFKGLYSFISHIDSLKVQGSGDGAKTLSENSNVVRIMTIHKSKGLEFPVVFLASCHRRFNTGDSSGVLIMHPKLGLGIDFANADKHIKYPLISKKAVSAKIRIDNISEEMRILYVALTRARTRLICSGVLSKPEKKLSEWYKLSESSEPLPKHKSASASSYFSWLKYALSDNWMVKIISETGTAKRRMPPSRKPKTSADADKAISEILEYKYPYEKAVSLPTKFSVSELKRRIEYDDASAAKLYTAVTKQVPDFLSEKSVTPAYAGTLNHLILKEIPLKEHSADDVRSFVSTLIRRGLISDEESEYINFEGIARFTKSSLGKRLEIAEKVLREFAFNVLIPAEIIDPQFIGSEESVLVQGVIDCLFEENGKIYVVDFKTDRYLSEQSKKMYKLQLDIYAYASEAITGKKVAEKYLYMLNDGNCMTSN